MGFFLRASVAAAFVILFFGAIAAKDGKCDLTIKVYGFKSDKGKARILIFKTGQEKYFPGKHQKAYKRKIASIKNKKLVYKFEDLPFGEYAVSVHHDEDDNGKVNTNWVGIPNESLGASNDAKGNFGPPSFEQAKIKLDSKKKTIKINMVN